jgi:hypothetical protein
MTSKHGMLALVNTPGITRLRLSYDEAAQRLQISLDGELMVEDVLDAAGRSAVPSPTSPGTCPRAA